jgi:hypothetical protein
MRNRTRRARHLPASARAVLALAMTAAAWLVALSHLTAALHFVLISHEICADHGELVHGSSSVGHRASVSHAPVALPAGEHAAHDHCPLWARRFEQAAVLGAANAGIAPLTLAPTLAAVASAGAVPTRAERLLSAPKQSPPA